MVSWKTKDLHGTERSNNPLCQNKNQQRNKKRDACLKRLQELETLVSSDAKTDHKNQLKTEYTALKEEIRLIYENKGKGSIIDSKMRWIEHRENRLRTF